MSAKPVPKWAWGVQPLQDIEIQLEMSPERNFGFPVFVWKDTVKCAGETKSAQVRRVRGSRGRKRQDRAATGRYRIQKLKAGSRQEVGGAFLFPHNRRKVME
jgi:hypothetical protein